MDEIRFQALADAYGGDVARWPQAERAAAEAFMDAKPARARSILSQAQALDQRLAEMGPAQPDSALFEAVIAAAPDPMHPPAAASAPVAGLAAALALMVGAGAGWIAAPAGDVYPESAFSTAFGVLEARSDLDTLAEEGAR